MKCWICIFEAEGHPTIPYIAALLSVPDWLSGCRSYYDSATFRVSEALLPDVYMSVSFPAGLSCACNSRQSMLLPIGTSYIINSLLSSFPLSALARIQCTSWINQPFFAVAFQCFATSAFVLWLIPCVTREGASCPFPDPSMPQTLQSHHTSTRKNLSNSSRWNIRAVSIAHGCPLARSASCSARYFTTSS